MKLRVAGTLLACTLMAASVPTIAYAMAAEQAPEQSLVVEQPPQQVGPRFVLDGVSLELMTYEFYNGAYHISVGELMALMDAGARVEEQEGLLTLQAQTLIVSGVDPREDETEDDDPHLPADGAVQVEGTPDTLSMTARAGEQYVEANGRYFYVEDGIRETDGRVLLPVRTLARALNLSVSYDADQDLVLLSSKPNAGYVVDSADHYNEEDLYWLSRVIHAESGNQSLEGQIAVGNVVMNRVRSKLFPNTIHEVLAQKNQFSTYRSGAIQKNTPGEDSVIAAKLVLDGAEVVPTALFFNVKSMKNSYAARTRDYVCTIGNHAFYA